MKKWSIKMRDRNQYIDEEHFAQRQECEQTGRGDFELAKAFAGLPDSYREILLLRFYANQSCQQIAGNLDMPLGAVTKTLSRAYSELHLLFEKQKK
jgi:DNA-directed RNA polymerase specialized sigma24 family protein